jgi:hypothetical protein
MNVCSFLKQILSHEVVLLQCVHQVLDFLWILLIVGKLVFIDFNPRRSLDASPEASRSDEFT